MVLQIARAPAAAWAASSKILADGQVGVARNPDGTDETRIGDGIHTWANLPAGIGGRVRKGDLVIDVRDYGAVCDGTTDDTSAVVSAAAAASALKVVTIGGNSYRAGATLFFPAGKTLKLTSLAAPIVLTCNVRGAGATLLAPQAYAQAVLRVGHPTSGNVLHNAEISLPDVTKTAPASDFTAGSIGVEIRNLTHSQVRFGRVSWFETAHHYNGVGIGTAYCEFFPGWVDLCKVGYALRPDVASLGWVNQNTWHGGGITQSANGFSGAATRRTGYRHVALDGGAGNVVHGNTFVGCSFEGDLSEYYLEFINAANNVFMGSTRFEQGTAPMTCTVNATTNVITTTSSLALTTGDPVTFLAVTTMPGGVTAGTVYYAKSISGNDFAISTTSGGATLDITSAGSGVWAFRPPTIKFDNSAGTTDFNRITEDFNSWPGPLGVIRVGAAASTPKSPVLG